jgi:hypothetical protein
MIFRDKNTGNLLNIRRDQYINDCMYFREIIRVVDNDNDNDNHKGIYQTHRRPRFTQPFHDFIITSEQLYLKP